MFYASIKIALIPASRKQRPALNVPVVVHTVKRSVNYPAFRKIHKTKPRRYIFSKPFEEKCIREVEVRIDSIIIFRLTKLTVFLNSSH